MESFLARLLLVVLLLAGVPAGLVADIRQDHPRIFVNTDPAYYNSLDSMRRRVTLDPWRAEYEKLRMWNNSYDDVPDGRKKANVLPGYALRWLIDSTDTAAADTALAMLLALDEDDGQSWNLSVAAIAYDWLYGYHGFSREDRRTVRERIAAWTRDVIQQIGTDDDVFNNHTWYHLRAVYLAGLALYHEDEEAPGWMQFADKYWKDNLVGAIRLFDGGWHEGLSYSCRASVNNLAMWLAAWESAATPRQWPFGQLRQKAGDWLNKFTAFYAAQIYPDGSLARYGDVPPFVADGGWDNSRLFMIVARAYHSGLAAWIVQNAGRPGQELLPLHIWYYLLWYDPAIKPTPPSEVLLRSVHLNPGTYDLFFMRSGWDEDATVVSFHAGDWFGSHDHLDVGHFSIFRKQWLALDAGVYTPMGGSHYVNFAHRTLAHNSLLIYDPEEQFQTPHDEGVPVINDGGQREVVSLGGRSTQYNHNVEIWKKNRLEGAHFERATVLHWFSGDTLDFVTADITMAYNSDFFTSYGRDFKNRPKVRQVMRSLAYLRPSTVVVYDRVLAMDSTFVKTWTLNTAHQPYLGEGNVFLAENGHSRLAGKTFLPQDPQREIWGSNSQPFQFLGVDMQHNYDLANYPSVEPGGWIVRISAAVGNAFDEFLHVMVAGESDRTSGDLLEGWQMVPGKGLRVLRNKQVVLAFMDGTELSPSVTLPRDGADEMRVFLLDVPEGIPFEVDVDGKPVAEPKSRDGVVEITAGPGQKVELKFKG